MSSPPGGHPDSTELAAFIDGRVSREERRRLVEHLAACEECYEVVAEAVHALDDEGGLAETPAAPRRGRSTEGAEAPTGAKIVVHPRARWGRWASVAGPLAAAAALAVVVGPRLMGPPTAEVLVRRMGSGGEIGARLPADWSHPVWDTYRGRGSDPSSEAAAFCLGARSVDLALALRSGDRERADALALEMVVYLGMIDLMSDFEADYDVLDERIKSGELLELVAEAAAGLDRRLGPELIPYDPSYDLGRWAEAGRLAAAAGEAGYFRARAVRRFAAKLELEALPEPLAAELGPIRELLRGAVAEGDLPELARRFTEVVRLGGTEGTYRVAGEIPES